MSEATGSELVPAADHALIREVLGVERQRIESNDRRTELQEKVIIAADATDQRQFEYHSKKLDLRAQGSRERRRYNFGLVAFVIVGLAAVVGVVLHMLFNGTDSQRETAILVADKMLSGLGGLGLWFVLRAVFQRIRSGPED